MYVSKLRIKNFRNFGDPPFEMALRPFTLLLGENNIGKTNLLAALSLLFSQELSIVQNRGLKVEDVNFDALAAFKKQVADDSLSPDAITFPEVVIEATLTGITDDQHNVIGDWYNTPDLTEASVTYRFSIRGNFNHAKWIAEQRESLIARSGQNEATRGERDENTNDVDYSHYVDFPIGDYRHTIYGGGRPSNECESWLLRMIKVEVLDALRDAERELIAGGEQRLLFRVLRQNGDSRYTDVKLLLDQLKEAIDVDPALVGIKEEVERLLKQVSLVTLGEDNSIGLQFAAPEASEILKRIGMTYGASPMTVARNGLGRNNLLYVALVLSQLAKASDPSGADSNYACFRLVGIEEPEAHLHPHLQDHLARNIEAVRKEHADTLQLIMTSHSTHVAAKLSLDNTAILFREDTDNRIASHYILDGIDDTKKNKRTARYLRLYLDATKSRMFFARRLILVEGISELTLLPVLFEQYAGRSLESIGCSVLNVNGVAFRHFLKIIKNGYFKKCVVLTDADTGTSSEDRAKKLREDFEDIAHIDIQETVGRTFEKDLISANISGGGKELLFKAICMTRPTNGPNLEKATGDGDIDVEKFFAEIEEYKAAFAFDLATVLNDEPDTAKKENRSLRTLNLPQYIVSAFEFITG